MDKINIECKNINYEMLNFIKEICNEKTKIESDIIKCKTFLDDIEKCTKQFSGMILGKN
jgi:hypothetical protein